MFSRCKCPDPIYSYEGYFLLYSPLFTSIPASASKKIVQCLPGLVGEGNTAVRATFNLISSDIKSYHQITPRKHASLNTDIRKVFHTNGILVSTSHLYQTTPTAKQHTNTTPTGQKKISTPPTPSLLMQQHHAHNTAATPSTLERDLISHVLPLDASHPLEAVSSHICHAYLYLPSPSILTCTPQLQLHPCTLHTHAGLTPKTHMPSHASHSYTRVTLGFQVGLYLTPSSSQVASTRPLAPSLISANSNKPSGKPNTLAHV